MPRTRRDNNSRKSKSWGKISGVTIETNPSGVTIYNSTIKTDNGYLISHDTDSEKSVAGILSCGGTSLARQTLGLTTINHVVASPMMNRAAVSPCVIAIVKPSGAAWASGVTSVDFYTYQTKNVPTAYGAGVSISYWAIGT